MGEVGKKFPCLFFSSPDLDRGNASLLGFACAAARLPVVGSGLLRRSGMSKSGLDEVVEPAGWPEAAQ